MSNESIIDKLKTALERGIESEVQVVYLLTGIRKLIERDRELGKAYPSLRFYCDWALHSKLDRGAAKEILRRRSIGPILKMDSFHIELMDFLFDRLRSQGEWQDFLRLYVGVISDIPMELKDRSGTVRSRVIVKPEKVGYGLIWQTFKEDGSPDAWISVGAAYHSEHNAVSKRE